MPTLIFTNTKSFDPSDNRPYADVTLTDALGTPISATYQCLVDTGSDYIILPISAAAGLVLSGTMMVYHGVTGSTSMNFEKNIDIIIETKKLRADILFDPSPGAGFIPILGRTAILTAFDLGVTVSDWHW